MTNTEIIEKISNIQGIEGMTVNERLVTSGLIKEFDKLKYKHIERTKLILQTVQVDKTSIDKIFLSLSKKRFLIYLVSTAINLAFTVFVISVLADGLMNYEIAFWLTVPLVACLTYYFAIGFNWFFVNINNFNFWDLTAFAILIFDILILTFNIFMWSDLFDGTTKILLP